MDKLWVESTSMNSNFPVMNELAHTSLDFSIGDLEDNCKKIFIISILASTVP